MPTFILYLLKLSIGLAVVYLFYQLVLRRLTFYRYNRWYLLVYPLVCFVIPFIDVAPLLQQSPKATALQWVPVLYQTVDTVAPARPNGWELTIGVLAAGSLIMLARLALQYFSLLRIKKQAAPLHTDGITVYQVNKNIMPFSFANGIYVNAHNHSPEELQEIIRHEYVHVTQRHSLDILLGELLCILNWFNPFVWLLRHAIRQNLEFIADNSVVESGIDKKAYQYLLLKVVGEPSFRIANQFNFSSLKKRIVMMNKIKSSKAHLLKFLFVLPLVAVLLLAFRKQITNIYQAPAKAVIDTLPPQQPSPADMNAIGQGNLVVKSNKAVKDFIKRHPNVKNAQYVIKVPEMGQSANDLDNVPILSITLNNGQKEKYMLNNETDLALFKERYGEEPPFVAVPPTPPAPPAPAMPPTAPEAAALPEAPEAPAAPEMTQHNAAMAQHDAMMAQHNAAMAQHQAAMDAQQAAMAPAAPPPPPPPPAPVKLPKHIKNIQINNKKATVTLRNGTVEQYDLNNPKEGKDFSEKYGQLAPPPPAAKPYKEIADKAFQFQWMPPIPKKPAPGDNC